jgi:hypothetical protein
MVLRIPGHRIARMGDRVSGGGGKDFVRRWMQSGGGQNGGAPRVLEAEGARPSCWDVREPGPTTSAPKYSVFRPAANTLSYTLLARA